MLQGYSDIRKPAPYTAIVEDRKTEDYYSVYRTIRYSHIVRKIKCDSHWRSESIADLPVGILTENYLFAW